MSYTPKAGGYKYNAAIAEMDNNIDDAVAELHKLAAAAKNQATLSVIYDILSNLYELKRINRQLANMRFEED